MKTYLYILIFLQFILSYSCNRSNTNKNDITIIPVKSEGKFQYIDKEGKILINPQFKDALNYVNGCALVKTIGDDPKWGYINEDGKYIIAPRFKSATIFNEDIAWVVSDNMSPSAINTNGEIKFTLQNAERVCAFSEGLAAFSIIDSVGEKWGFVNNEGKVVITPQFKNVNRFSENKCAVENENNKWGFINKNAEIIINYQFDGIAEKFINGTAAVYLDKKVGIINEKGKFIINPQFNYMCNDGENYLILSENLWGWCDKDGKIFINPQFDQALPFGGSELAAVKSNKTWGYIDINGKYAINPQFDNALPFISKLAPVKSGNKYGFIDINGKYVINPQFDDITWQTWIDPIQLKNEIWTINTDYFNINAIVNRIHLNAPEGLNASCNLKNVIDKLNVNESVFNKYSTNHLIINNKKITNDASYSFFILSNAFNEIPDGWYTKKVFNNNAIVNGFIYSINLFRKAIGKEKEVKTALENSFSDYNKDEARSNENISIYKNDKQTIVIYIQKSRVLITVQLNTNNFQNQQLNSYNAPAH